MKFHYLIRMKQKEKWYNDLQIVGTMLFFWPPLGFYGVYKSEKIQPFYKRVAYGTLIVALLLIALKLLV